MERIESKLKHLEFIQLAINRMAGNSFLLKAWTLTLVVAAFAFITKDSYKRLTIVADSPVLIFWLLDSFFLSQEKRFRALYDEVRTKSQGDIDFSMDTTKFRNFRNGWLRSLFTTTMVLFYPPLAGLIILFIYYIR